MVLKWEHPFTAILAGPTSCGKSTFVKKFLSEITVMVDTFFFEVIYCLPEDQPIDSFFLKFRVFRGTPEPSAFTDLKPRLVINR